MATYFEVTLKLHKGQKVVKVYASLPSEACAKALQETKGAIAVLDFVEVEV